MKRMGRGALLMIAVVCAFGCELVASAEAFLFSSTFTIPAALEIHADTDQPVLRLELSASGYVRGELRLSVGTNDWPLQLFLGLVEEAEAHRGSSLFYQFVRGRELGHAWVSMPTFSSTEPVDQLPFPAWTDYTLAVRGPLSGDAHEGTCRNTVRILLLSKSGQIAFLDVPIDVTID